MSDDTPTRRYPVGDDPVPSTPDPASDAPTERFTPPPPPGGTDGTGTGDEEPKKGSKALLITLICVGAALLLALIILLVVLFTSGSGGPDPSSSPSSESPSPTPSETSPSPTPSETPSEPPALPGPSIASYSVDQTQVDCSGGGPVGVTFAWQTTGTTLWFGVGTDDASAEPFGTFPTTHTLPFNYQCGQPDGQQRYTITVQGENSQKTSQTIVIREQ